MLRFLDVASVDKKIIIQALHSEMSDFEDAIQAYSAKQEDITIIITINEKDFTKSGMNIQRPETFLQNLQQVDV